jgi:hypothetical protein
MIKAIVRNGHFRNVWVNGAKGVVLSSDVHVTEQVKKGRLAYVREADNSHLDVVTRSTEKNLLHWLFFLGGHYESDEE